MAATVKDVAIMAGVSASTVSRVLNGSSHVTKETEKNVLKAVKMLNYSPNTMAKGLKGGNSRVIGLMLPFIGTSVSNYATCGVEQMARKRGYTVILCNTNEELLNEKEHVALLSKRGVDGFIFATATKNEAHQTYIQSVYNSGVPCVSMIRRLNEDCSVPSVVIDNYKAGYDVASEVIKNGGKNITIIQENANIYLYEDRVQGCVAACEKHGISPVILLAENDDFDFYAYLKSGAAVDNVIATNDRIAAKTITAITKFGKNVPRDIAVFGFGDLEISRLYNPQITTVKQPLIEVGSKACEILINLIENIERKREKTLFSCEIVLRNSTKNS